MSLTAVGPEVEPPVLRGSAPFVALVLEMNSSRSTLGALVGVAAATAQCVAGNATRDALFLTSLGFTALPLMIVATAVCSILLVAAYRAGSRVIAPPTLMRSMLLVSGALFVGEAFLRSSAPSLTAILVFLHVSGSSALLMTGFWMVARDRFDPAKGRFDQIAGAGTIGGLIGAFVAERVASAAGLPAMLFLLAVLHGSTAILLRLHPTPRPAVDERHGPVEERRMRSGLHIIAEARHLRWLATLVVLGTASAVLIEYLFKVAALETLGPGDNLLRFFALYYAATALATFALHTLSSGPVLDRFRPGVTSSMPSVALLVGGIGSVAAPGLGSLIAASGAEIVFRRSWFRAGHELFFQSLPAGEQTAARSAVDVEFDGLGYALGGAVVGIVVLFVPAAQSVALLSLAIVGAIGAMIAARRIHRLYVVTRHTNLLLRTGGRARSKTTSASVRDLIDAIEGRASQSRLHLVDRGAATTIFDSRQ